MVHITLINDGDTLDYTKTLKQSI